MTKEWVEQKNREEREKYEYQKEYLFNQLKTSEYLDDKERAKVLSFYEQGHFMQIENITSTVYTDFENIDGTPTQKSLDCMRWNKSLPFEFLAYFKKNKYDTYLDSDLYEFDGDIIITDPCYICKNKASIGEYPNESDFISYRHEEDYPDARELTKEEIEALDRIDQVLIRLKMKSRYYSKKYHEEKSRYNKALKLYHQNNISDWELCNNGFCMEKLGISHYMTQDTLYGDWSCTTYDSDTGKEIGEFCADAGLVSVFLLDEVLKYNPEFNYHLNRPWTTTWIKDFKGTIQFVIDFESGVYEEGGDYHKKGDEWRDASVQVVGHGINKQTGMPINFITHQTGL